MDDRVQWPGPAGAAGVVVVTGPVARSVHHTECGQLVLLVDGEPFELSGAEHLCRDYLAWHVPPDRRDPADLDVPVGWRPFGSRMVGAA